MATLYERAEVHLFKLCQGQGGVFRDWERYAALTLVKQTFGAQDATDYLVPILSCLVLRVRVSVPLTGDMMVVTARLGM